MTDLEYDILDELYFLSSFEDLSQKLKIKETSLREELKSLYRNGWIKLLNVETEEEIEELQDFDLYYKKYNYLVSKAGLLAHNSR